MFSTGNEAALKAAAGPQIVPVYGIDFRSTPIAFLQDDHDHWENDAVTDEITNFPIPWCQLQLARATQQLYYPELLPDAAPLQRLDKAQVIAAGGLQAGRAEQQQYERRNRNTGYEPHAG